MWLITNSWNKFVTQQRVLGMVESGLLVITSYDRESINFSSVATQRPLRPAARRCCGAENASKTPKSVSVCGRSQRRGIHKRVPVFPSATLN